MNIFIQVICQQDHHQLYNYNYIHHKIKIEYIQNHIIKNVKHFQYMIQIMMKYIKE